MRTTNLIVAGKYVVVAGYGWCGKGVALRAKGLGAKVIVTEVDPIRAMEAAMDGYEVMTMDEAAAAGDIFVTVTGCKDVITGKHFRSMKNGAILSNAGHFDVEVNVAELKEMSSESYTARNNITAYKLDGKELYVLGEGRLVNLAAADGHPAEIMDLSFAIQALSLKYLLSNKGKLTSRVYNVPEDIDKHVAQLKLKAMGISIDALTDEQYAYMYGGHV
jgi:adenosylhomocysteinase